MSRTVTLKNVTKTFGDLTACDSVSFEVKKGSVHAVVGENGAGKSTIMKIVFGLYRRDSGEILINGNPVNFQDPSDAIREKIFMVHQHFMQIPTMTVAENIILGDERSSASGQLKYAEAEKNILGITEQFGMKVDPSSLIQDLSVSEQQRVEILSALYRGAELLILDEPTAVLTPSEVDEFFQTIRLLTGQGKTVVIVTHKLDEVMAISDEVTVMRAGKVTGRLNTSETSIPKIASLMVGKEVLMEIDNPPHEAGKTVLSMKNICFRSGQRDLLKNVSIEVRAGEVVGIAGIGGNGQLELENIISGMARLTSGEFYFQGEKIEHHDPHKARALGMGHIPSDREELAYVKSFDNSLNLIFGYHFTPDFCNSLGILKKDIISEKATELHEKFNIMPRDIAKHTVLLSGGNKQKLVVAREFSRMPTFILICNPTRGVDISAIEFIHKEIFRLRDAGAAILLISSELSEVIGLSDRGLVMCEGEIVGEFDPQDCDEYKIGMMMIGQAEPAGAH